MGVPVLLALYVWLRPERGYRADPVRALRGVAGVMLALALGRAVQELLPLRPRPRIALPDFPFPPLGHLEDLADWSSMPSDHAALAFALAAVVWAGSRRLGLLAMAWSVFVVCLPRLYFGYHNASDLIAGAALGLLSVTLTLRVPLPWSFTLRAEGWIRRLEARAPTLLLLAFFVLGFECLTLFHFARVMGAAVGEAAHAADSDITALPGTPFGPAAAAPAHLPAGSGK